MMTNSVENRSIIVTGAGRGIGRSIAEGLARRDNEAFARFSADILLGRPSRADDLAGVSIFLTSGGSDYMTGQSLVVGGGMVLV